MNSPDFAEQERRRKLAALADAQPPLVAQPPTQVQATQALASLLPPQQPQAHPSLAQQEAQRAASQPVPAPAASPAASPSAASPQAGQPGSGTLLNLPRPSFGVVGTNTFRPSARQVQLAPELAPETRVSEDVITTADLPSDQLYARIGAQRLAGKAQVDPATGKARIKLPDLQRAAPLDAQRLLANALPDRNGFVQVDAQALTQAAGQAGHLGLLNGESLDLGDGVYSYNDRGQLIRSRAEQVTAEQASLEVNQAQQANLAAQAAEADQLELQQGIARSQLNDARSDIEAERAARAEEQAQELQRISAEREQATREFAAAPPPGTQSFYERNTTAAVLSMIGAAFLGLAEKPELAAANIDKLLETDLRKQEAAYQAKGAKAKALDTVYAQAKERFGDREAAMAAAKAAMLSTVERDVEDYMFRAQGNQRALERGAELLQQTQRLKGEQLQIAASYQDRVAESQVFDPRRMVATGGTDPQKYIAKLVEQKLITPEQGQKMFSDYAKSGQVVLPGSVGAEPNGLELTPTAKTALQKQVIDTDEALGAASNLEQLSKQSEGRSLTKADKKVVEQQVEKLRTYISTMRGQGVITEADAERMKDSLPVVSNWNVWPASETEAIARLAQDMRETRARGVARLQRGTL
jgi:hypothetical protein